jgi:hypothetical protein
MHYVTRRSHQKQKHMFGVMCRGAFLRRPHRVHPSMKNSVSMFFTPELENPLRDPQIPLDAKHKFCVTCPSALFVEFVLDPPEHEK